MERAAQMAAGMRRTLWREGEPDPRALQGAFVLMVLLTVGASLPLHRGWWSEPAGLAASAIAAAALAVAAVATPRVASTSRLLFGLAITDLAAIGVSSLQTDAGTLPLVVLPAVLLGRLQGWRGVSTSGVATLLLVAAPAVLVHGNFDDTVSQVIALPIVAMFGAFAMAAGIDSTRRARLAAESVAAELAAQRATSEAFVATVDVGLVQIDREGRVVMGNRRQREIDELKYPEGRGRGAEHVYAANGTTPIAERQLPSARAARGEEFDDLRIWIGANPHTRRAFSVSARNLRHEDGRRVGSALAYQEITDLVRALTVKDEFIGLVSHELRTPLTSIFGYACLLRDRDDLPSVVVRQLDTVARSADRLQVLVDDLLQATQVAGGGLHLKRAPHDLVGILDEAVESARPHAEEAGVELRVSVGGPVVVDVDRVRLAQVVDNLLSNAIKYTQPGGWASIALIDGPGEVEVCVSDNGIGIRSEDLSRVFGRFYRTREVAERAIQGAGLGLAITRTIVEQHGGRVDVDSRPGSGSEFRVRLPRIDAPYAVVTSGEPGGGASRLAS